MKKTLSTFCFALLFASAISFAQDIPQSQVPSVVVNSFQKAFPKASDIEWEMDGDLYKVDFETDLISIDHEAWYKQTGELVKHKEDISRSDLPQKVLSKVSGHQIRDVEKITEGDKVIYTLELHSTTDEWRLAMDADGNVLSRMED